MDAVNSSELQSHSGGLEEARLRALVEENPGNFDAWTLLIKEIEKTSPNDIERIFSVYDAFLFEFPLCYGYWKKYADHRSRLCTIDKVVEVYERAVTSATYSVGLWVNYCSFGMLSFEDPVDIRRLFERALSFVGKDYLCHHLWDKYIEFEYSQKQWSHLAHIYLRSLRFPTKKLHMYHKSFKRLISICEEEMKYQDIDATNVSSQVVSNSEITGVKACEGQEISRVIEDLLAPSVGVPIPNTLNKYVSSGEYLYQKASELDSKIKCFECRIRRPYFHIKLLDDDQLENWHHYLDFVEMQGDFDWTVKLYERCLIPCANYPEFWIRYVEFVEAKGGREIANLALVRATDVYLKRVPGIHLFCARFKEQIGDISGAHAAFLQCGSDLEPDFIENVTRKANMEKRLGNVEAALIVYEKAIDVAKEKQDSHTLGILYAQFSHFTYMVTASIDAARDVLIKGIQHLPQCKLLLERLIHFEMMHGGPRKIDVLDSIIAEATAPVTDALQGLSINDREDISKLFLEFVDFCGSIHEIKKAWDRHRKLFPYQMRAVFSYDHMSSRNGYADNTKTGGNDNPAALPHGASVDKHTECSAHHSILNDTSLQKSTDTQSDLAVTDQSKLGKTDDDLKEGLQQVQSAIVAQEGPKLDAAEEHVVVYDSVQEDDIHPQAIQMEENAEVSNHVLITHDQKPQDDLIPPALETLSINPQEDEFQQTSPTPSLDCRAPEGSSMSNGNGPLDGDTTSEITIPHSTCMQSNMSPQRNLQEQSGHVLVESDPISLKQIQTQTITDSQQIMPSTVDGGHSHQLNHNRQDQRDPRPCGYAEPRKRRQRQASQRSQYPTSGMQPRMLTGQGYPCQPQVWQNQQAQQANLAPNQYQVGTGQVYPTSTHVWPAQNVQPQTFASVSQGQPSTHPIYHPQAQVYQYPYQSSQGFTPQMWDYYQQQQNQLQQQHQNQQLQVQQQQPPQQQLQLQQQQQVQLQQPPQQQLHLQQQQFHLQQQQQQIQPQQVQQQLPVQPQPPQQQLLYPQQQQQIQPQEQLPLQQQPPPQQLYPQQQEQYHLQQQQQLQMWNYNYYSQFPVQYYESSQYGQDYGQQAIGSQGQVANQHDVEQSSHADPPQEQVPSTQ